MAHPAAADTVFRLGGAVQTYAWGVRGSGSKVAQLARRIPGFQPDDNAHYAELWLGTHPSAPSQVLSTDGAPLGPLRAALGPALLGNAVYHKFGGDLPFLFKVLAIDTALSIQAHPNKADAQRLHAKNSQLYPDPNHKPELAIALTPFEALVGFRPLTEIAHFLLALEELAAAVGVPAAQQFVAVVQQGDAAAPDARRAALQGVFAGLMKADPPTVAALVGRLAARLAANDPQAAAAVPAPVAQLFARLHAQYPGDVGCLCVFLLNYVQLQPGQAIFLAAGLPHAYVAGECVECMAASDNVVRAGLTPKHRDVDTLLEILSWASGPPHEFVLEPLAVPPAGPPSPTLSPVKGQTLAMTMTKAQPTQRITSHLYCPPLDTVPEFQVMRTALLPGEFLGWSAPVNGPSVLLVTAGAGTLRMAVGQGYEAGPLQLVEGDAYFIGADTSVAISANADSPRGLEVFRAFCPGSAASITLDAKR